MSFRLTIIALSVCLLPVHLLAQTPPLVLSFGTVDSMYPNVCAAGDQCYPNIANRDNPDRVSLGGVGSNTHVAWKSVNFPVSPDSIIVNCSSGLVSVMDFFLDGLDGLFFWSFSLPKTTDAPYWWSEPFVNNSTRIDYTLFPEPPVIAGAHKLFIAFSCEGAGCGQYHSITFTFNSVGAKTKPSGIAGRSYRQGPSLVNLSMTGTKMSNFPAASVIYDVHGRRLSHATAKHSGIAVVASRRP